MGGKTVKAKNCEWNQEWNGISFAFVRLCANDVLKNMGVISEADCF